MTTWWIGFQKSGLSKVEEHKHSFRCAHGFVRKYLKYHGVHITLPSDLDESVYQKFLKRNVGRYRTELKTAASCNPQKDSSSVTIFSLMDSYVQCYCSCNQNISYSFPWPVEITTAQQSRINWGYLLLKKIFNTT